MPSDGPAGATGTAILGRWKARCWKPGSAGGCCCIRMSAMWSMTSCAVRTLMEHWCGLPYLSEGGRLLYRRCLVRAHRPRRKHVAAGIGVLLPCGYGDEASGTSHNGGRRDAARSGPIRHFPRGKCACRDIHAVCFSEGRNGVLFQLHGSWKQARRKEERAPLNQRSGPTSLLFSGP